MNNMLITVIVPIYNTEKYLKRCIDSIINQTYRNIEIILVDDGSTDDSLNICMEYKELDSRIRVISQENQGQSGARKSGVENASGSLICFVDSDDWIEPDMYESMVAIYEETGAELISTGAYHETKYGVTEHCDYFEEGLYTNLDSDIYPTMLRDDTVNGYGLHCSLWNKLFLRDKLLEVYDNINLEVFYGEDCLTIYPYCLLINSVYISHKIYYHYEVRNGSMSRCADERLLYNNYLLYNGLKQAFMNYSNPYVLLRQLRNYIWDLEQRNLLLLYDINTSMLGKWEFSYDFQSDDKVVIYGAGICGQALYRQYRLAGKEDCVVAWLDKDYKAKSLSCLCDIASPDKLLNMQYDYIIIAVIEEGLAKEIKAELVSKWKIKEEKILWDEVVYDAKKLPFVM